MPNKCYLCPVLPQQALGSVSVSGLPARLRLWADGVATFSPSFRSLSRPPSPVRSGARVFRVRRRRVRAAAMALFDASCSVYMVTFTFPVSLDESERVERVRRFARWLSKEAAAAKGVVGYVWVLERHLTGRLHAHFLVGLADGRRRLWVRSLVEASERWTCSLNGLDVRRVRGARAVSAYVSKYVSKSQAVFSFRAYGVGGVARFHVRPFFGWFACADSGGFVFRRSLFYAPFYVLFDSLLAAASGQLWPRADVSRVYSVGESVFYSSPPAPPKGGQ